VQHRRRTAAGRSPSAQRQTALGATPISAANRGAGEAGKFDAPDDGGKVGRGRLPEAHAAAAYADGAARGAERTGAREAEIHGFRREDRNQARTKS